MFNDCEAWCWIDDGWIEVNRADAAHKAAVVTPKGFEAIFGKLPLLPATAKAPSVLKSSRANIIGNVRPLKPNRFSCLGLRDRFCTISSEQVENKEGKRIANAANG